MKKILVTGSAGFIGYHVVLRLTSMDYEIIGIDNLNDYYDPELKIKRLRASGLNTDDLSDGQALSSSTMPSYRFLKLDLADKGRMIDLFRNEKFDIVIHLAAQPGARKSVDDPDKYISNNIIGFYNLLEACRQYPPEHLLYASSSSVYGLNEQMPYAENDMTDQPASLYGATKKSNELMAHAYSYLYKIPMTGLRFFTVYGPWGRPDMVYSLYTRAILENEPIKVFNDGRMKRDFTYVDDITKGVMDVMQAIPEGNVPFRVFNIGNSHPVSLVDFISTLEKILGKEAIKEMLPMQQGDVLETYADTSLLEKYCGYKPFTSLEEGLKEFVSWYLDNY